MHSPGIRVETGLGKGKKDVSCVHRIVLCSMFIYGIIVLPVVLYGCETWSLTLQEERKLRVFEKMVFRRIFGPRRDKVMGEWRRLHNVDGAK